MRKSTNTPPGIPFAVPWTEWHCDCAGGCGESQMFLSMGKADTARQADKLLKEEGPEADGWKKLKGKWYCPACSVIE